MLSWYGYEELTGRMGEGVPMSTCVLYIISSPNLKIETENTTNLRLASVKIGTRLAVL